MASILFLALTQLILVFDMWYFPFLSAGLKLMSIQLSTFGFYCLSYYPLFRLLLAGLFLTLAAAKLRKVKKPLGIGAGIFLIAVNLTLCVLYFPCHVIVSADSVTLAPLLAGCGVGLLILSCRTKSNEMPAPAAQ